jgi:hypothetical protein
MAMTSCPDLPNRSTTSGIGSAPSDQLEWTWKSARSIGFASCLAKMGPDVEKEVCPLFSPCRDCTDFCAKRKMQPPEFIGNPAAALAAAEIGKRTLVWPGAMADGHGRRLRPMVQEGFPEFLEDFGRRAGTSFEGSAVDLEEVELRAVAVEPFVVVREGPVENAVDGEPARDRGVEGGGVGAEVVPRRASVAPARPGGICPSMKPPRRRTSGSLRTVQSLTTCPSHRATTRENLAKASTERGDVHGVSRWNQTGCV